MISSRSIARRRSDSIDSRSDLRARIDGLNTSMRSPPHALGVIHGELGVLQPFLGALRLGIRRAPIRSSR